jgi:hypothetical protein
MSIRIRRIDGHVVALCAARSVEKPGDVYLDDAEHYALSEKFWDDYPQLGIPGNPETAKLREQEEENNPNRDNWDMCWGEQKEGEMERECTCGGISTDTGFEDTHTEDCGERSKFLVHFKCVKPGEETTPGYFFPEEQMGVSAYTAEEAWGLFLEGVPIDQRSWYQQTRPAEKY